MDVFPFIPDAMLRTDTCGVLDQLRARQQQRDQSWHSILVTEFSDLWQEWLEPAVIGAFAATYLGKSRRRELSVTTKLTLDEGTFNSPSATARDYLSATYRRRRSLWKHEQLDLWNKARMPLMARPAIFADGYYVDIRSAWWAIQMRAGWNVDYWPGLWLSPGRPPYDFPFHDPADAPAGEGDAYKLARSVLVTIARGNSFTMHDPRHAGDPRFDQPVLREPAPGSWQTAQTVVKPRRASARSTAAADDPNAVAQRVYEGAMPKEVAGWNPVMNPGLFALIADVLQSIAWQARERLGPALVYWSTDGAIVTSAAARDTLIELIAAWGLEARVKYAGPGWVRGCGTWRVGYKVTDRKMTRPMEITQGITGGTLGDRLGVWLYPIWEGILLSRGWRMDLNGDGAV